MTSRNAAPPVTAVLPREAASVRIASAANVPKKEPAAAATPVLVPQTVRVVSAKSDCFPLPHRPNPPTSFSTMGCWRGCERALLRALTSCLR